MPVTISYEGLPEHIRGGIKRYIEEKIPPGGFLTAVLSNDLVRSFASADHVNRHMMFDIVKWLYNEAPKNCWGSPERVKAWLNGGESNGRFH